MPQAPMKSSLLTGLGCNRWRHGGVRGEDVRFAMHVLRRCRTVLYSIADLVQVTLQPIHCTSGSRTAQRVTAPGVAQAQTLRRSLWAVSRKVSFEDPPSSCSARVNACQGFQAVEQ